MTESEDSPEIDLVRRRLAEPEPDMTGDEFEVAVTRPEDLGEAYLENREIKEKLLGLQPVSMGIESGVFQYFGDHGDPVGYARVITDEEGTHTYFQPEPAKGPTDAEIEEAYWENRLHNDIRHTYGLYAIKRSNGTYPWGRVTEVVAPDEFKHQVLDEVAIVRTAEEDMDRLFGLSQPKQYDLSDEDNGIEHTTIYADNIAVATIPTPMPYEALRSDAEGLHAHINGRWHPVATMGQMEKWRDLVKITRETSDRHHQRYLTLVQALEKHCEWLDLNNVGPSWRSNPEATAIREIIESTKKL